MRPSGLILFIVFSVQLMAQQASIKGIVSVHNSEINTGRRQYIANAQVEDPNGNAQPKVTDNNGKFELLFIKTPPNTSVTFRVKVKGYEVVLPTPLLAVPGQRDPLKISMANPDSMYSYLQQLYKIGKTEAEKRYEEKAKKLNDELLKLRKSNQSGITSIKQLEVELKALREQSKSIDQLAYELVEKFKNLNIDDTEEEFKKAYILFRKGLLDSALTVLKSDVRQLDKELKDLAALIQASTARVADIKKQQEADYQLTAGMHKVRFEFDSTTVYLLKLINSDSTNIDYLLDYGNFLDFLNKHDDALHYYNKALALSYSRLTTDSINGKRNLARTLYNQGLLYLERNATKLAENALNEALALRKDLASRNPEDYEPYVANTLNALGKLCSIKKDFNLAERFFQEALGIRTRLGASNPKVNNPEAALIYNNLGTLYYNRNEFQKADSSFQYALQITREQAQNEVKIHDIKVANIILNLGNLYTRTGNYSRAKNAYLEAFSIIDSLALLYPDIYALELSTVQNHLGASYVIHREYAAAEASFKAALDTRRKLAAVDSATHTRYVAQSLNSLGSLYSATRDFSHAVLYYNEALTLTRSQADVNPEVFEPEMAAMLANLARAYYAQGNFTLAKAACEEAIRLYNRYAAVSIFKPNEARMKHLLGQINHQKKEYLTAESNFRDALNIYRQLAVTAPATYQSDIANTLVELSAVFESRKEPAKAETFLLEALTTYAGISAFNRRVSDLGIALVKFKLGVIFNVRKESAQAEGVLNEAMDIYKRYVVSDPATFTLHINQVQKELDKLKR